MDIHHSLFPYGKLYIHLTSSASIFLETGSLLSYKVAPTFLHVCLLENIPHANERKFPTLYLYLLALLIRLNFPHSKVFRYFNAPVISFLNHCRPIIIVVCNQVKHVPSFHLAFCDLFSSHWYLPVASQCPFACSSWILPSAVVWREQSTGELLPSLIWRFHSINADWDYLFTWHNDVYLCWTCHQLQFIGPGLMTCP